MSNYQRHMYPKIKEWLFSGKVILIYGARQVGKSTLSKAILNDYPDSLYINCEREQAKEILESNNPERMMGFIGNAKLVVLDEAQKVGNIGQSLKLLVDTYPNVQLIATGSSSFDLSNEVNEPLTGRNVKFPLYPLSLSELSQKYDRLTLHEKLEDFLRFGFYPDIVDRPEKQKITLLDEIATDYLYRDVLEFQNLKHSDLLMNLLKALAFQMGNEVSFRELATLLKTSVETIQRYIILLEQSFVIFKLGTFSRNLRKELAHSQKYYFFDLGIRNSLIQNYNRLEYRQDVGALWENFCIVERLKHNQVLDHRPNLYFWRTYDQKEIDLVEESGGELKAFEFKWNERQKTKPPKDFLDTYENTSFQIVSRENYWEYVG